MNKIVRTGIQGPLLAVVLAMLLAGLSTYGQGAATHADRGRTAVQKAVASARSASFWIVTQDFRGTFDKVDSYLETFTAEFVRQGLDVSLQSESPTAILVLYEDPALERMNRLSVGFIVPTSVKAQAPLQAQLWQQDLAATVPHRGPYQDLEKVGASLNSELKSRGSSAGWPVVMRLLNDPRVVPAAEIATELVVPIVTPARAKLAAAEQAAIATAVQKAAPWSSWFVSQTFEGSPAQIDGFLDQFQREFEAQGLGRALAGPEVVPIAWLYGNPDEQKSVKIEIGFPVKERGVAVKSPLSAREVALPKAASYVHQGAFSGLATAFHGLERTAASKNLAPGWPVGLQLLTDPARVKSTAELRTGLIVPLGSGKS